MAPIHGLDYWSCISLSSVRKMFVYKALAEASSTGTRLLSTTVLSLLIARTAVQAALYDSIEKALKLTRIDDANRCQIKFNLCY